MNQARMHRPSIVVFDGLDVLCPAPDDTNPQHGLRVSILSECLVDVVLAHADIPQIFCIATCTSSSSLHESLQRSQFLSLKLEIPAPSAERRRAILQQMLVDRHVQYEEDIFDMMGSFSEGFACNDLIVMADRLMSMDELNSTVLQDTFASYTPASRQKAQLHVSFLW